jgi:hypothetical protein
MTTITTNAAAALISYTFLSGQDMFGAAAPFATYFVFSVGSLVFACIAIPDTGDVVAGGDGKDVDDIIDSMPLWKIACCRGSLCARRRRGGGKSVRAITTEGVNEEEDSPSSGIIT